MPSRAVDFHVHLPTPDWLDGSMAGYVEAAEAYFRATAQRETVARACEQYPDAFTGLGSVDPHKGEQAVTEVAEIARLGLRGVKFHPSLQAFDPGDPAHWPIFAACQEHGLIALFHTGTSGIGARRPGGQGIRIDYAHPLRLDPVAAAHPDLTVVAAHFGWPWQMDLIAVALHKTNVYIDISGWAPRRIPPEVVRELRGRLSGQFLWGLAAAPYDVIMEADSSSDAVPYFGLDRLSSKDPADWAAAGATWWIESWWSVPRGPEGLADVRRRVQAGPSAVGGRAALPRGLTARLRTAATRNRAHPELVSQRVGELNSAHRALPPDHAGTTMPLTVDPLPVRLSPLVGRDSELNDIAQALAGSRLLTLTGPGGTGKTRLALAVAAATPGTTCWVDLAPIDDPAIVGTAIAASLSVPEIPGQDTIEALIAHIAGQQLLLVLDNCEHLLDAVASLAERLLAGCPDVTALATSREPLGVEGERTWPVPPLARGSAVTLFEQRAQLVRPAFKVTDDNAADVQLVCERLDDLPLAIELAAARMRVLSSAQLAARLDDMFSVLTGGARSAPARHQTLRATLDWSHDMLGTDERVTLRRLAVFSGGFTLDAAEHVAADGVDIESAGMLDLLTRLADKSLVRVGHTTESSRYELLGTIRDYAAAKLASTPDNEPVRRAHLHYYTEFAETAAARDDGELGVLDDELPNLRIAIEYAHQSGEPVAALRIASSLDRYAALRGHYHEVRQWLDTAVNACPDAPAGLRAKALLGGGRLALLQCDYAPAVRRGEAALRLYRELGEARGVSSGLQLLGSVAREQGRYARAAELYAESLAGAEAAGDRRAQASVHGSLAFVYWLQLDFDQATAAAGRSLDICRELGDIEGVASALIHLGIVARLNLDSERAVVLLTEARSIAEDIGFREGIAWTLEQLGLLAAERGDPDAAAMLRGSLEIHTDLRDRWRMASLLEDLAVVALREGNPARTARLLGAAEAIREAIGTVIAPAERARHHATTEGAQAALGAERFGAARQQGLLATAEDLRADLPRAGARAADTAAVPALDLSAFPAAAGQASPAVTGPAATGPAATGPAVTVPAVTVPAVTVPAVTGPATAGRTADGAAPAARSAAAVAPPAGPLRIRTLGAAEVRLGDVALTAADWGYAKPRELLFLLASSPPLTRDQIGSALWPDLSGRQLGNALHTALRELRRALGDAGWVRYADGHYQFDRTREHECDVTAFEDALSAARRARPSAAGPPAPPAQPALPDLQRAIAVYGGDFLDGMSVGEWALTRRDELRRAFESALLASGRMLAAAGRYQAAASAFRRAVAHEPLNESAHRELMTCWVQLGETARAVRHYEELAERLRAQLGVSPAAETTALYRRLTGG